MCQSVREAFKQNAAILLQPLMEHGVLCTAYFEHDIQNLCMYYAHMYHKARLNLTSRTMHLHRAFCEVREMMLSAQVKECVCNKTFLWRQPLFSGSLPFLRVAGFATFFQGRRDKLAKDCRVEASVRPGTQLSAVLGDFEMSCDRN